MSLQKNEPTIFDAITKEQGRQNQTLELIASEKQVSIVSTADKCLRKRCHDGVSKLF